MQNDQGEIVDMFIPRKCTQEVWSRPPEILKWDPAPDLQTLGLPILN